MVEASGTGDAQPGAPERGEFARQLIVITVVALILRLAYVAFIRPHDAVLAPDAFLYHQGANLLADGRGFIDPYVFVNEGIVTPAADHPPVYMLYLAFFSFLGLTSPLAHMVASTFLGAATVVMVGLTGHEVGRAQVVSSPPPWPRSSAISCSWTDRCSRSRWRCSPSRRASISRSATDITRVSARPQGWASSWAGRG